MRVLWEPCVPSSDRVCSKQSSKRPSRQPSRQRVSSGRTQRHRKCTRARTAVSWHTWSKNTWTSIGWIILSRFTHPRPLCKMSLRSRETKWRGKLAWRGVVLPGRSLSWYRCWSNSNFHRNNSNSPNHRIANNSSRSSVAQLANPQKRLRSNSSNSSSIMLTKTPFITTNHNNKKIMTILMKK